MIVNLSKRLERVLIGICILLMVFGVFYFAFYKSYHDKLVAKRIEDASIPRTANGPWKKYIWQGKRYIYPPEWTLTERKKYENEEDVPIGERDTNVASFIISPTNKIGEDSIYVGGGISCSSAKYVLCVGNEPVYTNSRNANVMNVFNTMIKSVK